MEPFADIHAIAAKAVQASCWRTSIILSSWGARERSALSDFSDDTRPKRARQRPDPHDFGRTNRGTPWHSKIPLPKEPATPLTHCRRRDRRELGQYRCPFLAALQQQTIGRSKADGQTAPCCNERSAW